MTPEVARKRIMKMKTNMMRRMKVIQKKNFMILEMMWKKTENMRTSVHTIRLRKMSHGDPWICLKKMLRTMRVNGTQRLLLV